MRIGFTYDLRDDFPPQGLADDEAAECESQDTVEAIADTIASLGHDVDCIGHLKTLAARLVAGDRWDLVFNIAEGTSGLSRESQVPALLDAYDIPYTFSDPLTLGLSLHKGMAKRVVRDCGVATPPFVVVENVRDLRGLALPFPVFAKPVAEGSSKGISQRSIAATPEALAAICETLLERYQQPVLVEEYLPGREFTVGIVGSAARARSLGAMEISLTDLAEPGVYSRHNKVHYKGRVSYSLVDPELQDQAASVALAAWHALGCRDGGRVDLRCDRHGVINFMEVNPLPGLDPITGDLVVLCGLHDIPYRTLLQAIVEAACERLATSRQASPAAIDGHADVVRP
jgi:D-alanine-D-alanine ligase